MTRYGFLLDNGGSHSAHMRIVLATDAWEPQVNGVVRTLTRTDRKSVV